MQEPQLRSKKLNRVTCECCGIGGSPMNYGRNKRKNLTFKKYFILFEEIKGSASFDFFVSSIKNIINELLPLFIYTS